MPDTFEADATARRITAFGLPNGDERSAPAAMREGDWKKVLAILDGQRVTGFAVAAAQAGWLDLSDEQDDELLEVHRRAMLSPLSVERGLVEVAKEFDCADIQFVVLKGPAVAHTVYPDPSWRFFGDLDLLVRSEDWKKAAVVLDGLGYRRNLPEPRTGFDLRFGKAAEFRRVGGIEVDLHRTLVVGPFGLWIDPDVLFEGTTELRLFGRTLKRLDDTLLQLHACMHASLGWWPPLKVPMRDVVQVGHFSRVDWDELAELAARWKLRAVVRHALRMATENFETTLPAGAERAIAQKPTRLESRALLSYTGGRRDQGGTALWTLRAIRGLRPKLAYIRALIFPGREFMAVRGGSTRASYLRRWAVPIRWLRRRRGRA